MPFSAFRFSSGPSRLATLFALLLAALLLAAPVRAQEPAALLGALKARAAASTASEAPAAANPKLVQQAARETQPLVELPPVVAAAAQETPELHS